MNRKYVLHLALGLGLAVLLSACNGGTGKTPTPTKPANGETQPQSGETPPPTGDPVVETPEKEKKIELKVVKNADLVKVIEGHKGKVVLVDFWATWCQPCKEKFPKVVELHETYRDKGLICIAVSWDDPEDKNSALAFLKKQNALFPNFLVEDPEQSQDRWDFASIPTYLVYGRDGKLVRRFTADPEADKQYTMDDIQKTIEKELK